MLSRYKHSGRVPPLGLVIGLGVGLLASLALVYPYDYGIIHIPSVKLRIFCTVIFGFMVGVAAGWGLALGKVRNTRVAGIAGILTALAALYVSWGAWLILVLDEPTSLLPRLLLRPWAMWQLLQAVNVDGTWGSGGSATKGVELWIIWILEAATILLLGLLGAVVMMGRLPFCESCEHWCKKAGELLIAATVQPANLKASVDKGDLGFLAEARLATKKEPRYSFTWYSCPSCHGLNTLSVTFAQAKSSKQLANHLMISGAEVEVLRNFQSKAGSLVVATAG